MGRGATFTAHAGELTLAPGGAVNSWTEPHAPLPSFFPILQPRPISRPSGDVMAMASFQFVFDFGAGCCCNYCYYGTACCCRLWLLLLARLCNLRRRFALWLLAVGGFAIAKQLVHDHVSDSGHNGIRTNYRQMITFRVSCRTVLAGKNIWRNWREECLAKWCRKWRE